MLKELMILASLNQVSKGDMGEVARVERKLAEAFDLKGDFEEASRLKAAAETKRKDIQGARFDELPDCDLSYAMMNFHAIW